MKPPPHEDVVKARARFALQAVRSLRGDKAKQQLKGLPVMLRTLGLLQSTALLKSDSELRPLADHLATWLLDECPMPTLLSEQGGSASRLLEAASDADPASLRAAEHEAVEITVTMKLFGDALG
ncbi:MAG: hypothetical protein JW940_14630 [Polyangiaceae bacterium]|nr:hypothetical protein [Polyangiaceae bacterium]